MSAQINKSPQTRHVCRFCSNLLPNEASFHGDFVNSSLTYERAFSAYRSRTRPGKPSRTTHLLVFYARKNCPRLPVLWPTSQRAKHPTTTSEMTSGAAVTLSRGRGDLLTRRLYSTRPVRDLSRWQIKRYQHRRSRCARPANQRLNVRQVAHRLVPSDPSRVLL